MVAAYHFKEDVRRVFAHARRICGQSRDFWGIAT